MSILASIVKNSLLWIEAKLLEARRLSGDFVVRSGSSWSFGSDG
jgi:hypothetical protein